jgi:CGNR zinc finger protein
MYFEVELNLLAIGSVRESDGWFYGALSSASPAYLVLKDTLKDSTAEFDPHKYLLAYYTYPQIPPSALLEFVNLREGDTEQAIAYLRRYGLLSLSDLKAEDLPKDIRAYFDDLYENDLVPFGFRFEHLWGVQKTLKERLTLTRAAIEREKATAERILSSIDKGDYDSEIADLYGGDWRRFARDGYRVLVLGKPLANLQFSAREKGDLLVPTIITYGVVDALSVFLVDHMSRDSAMGECQNPQCKKLFFVTRKSKRFCSPRCQGLIKVHRFRKNVELRKKATKRKQIPKTTKRKGGK